MNFLKRLIHKWLFTYTYEICILDGNGRIPTRAYKNDAGYDLYTSSSLTIGPHKTITIPTGISCKSKSISAWILLTSRSSTLSRYGIIVNDAVIDGDFTGELYIIAYNTTDKQVHIPLGIRISQIIVIPHTNIKFKIVRELQYVGRGSKGFGSTGK